MCHMQPYLQYRVLVFPFYNIYLIMKLQHFVCLESKGKTKTQRKKRKRVKNFSDTSSEEEGN